MDLLTESSILTCKEYGKAKVYLINQDMFPETSKEQLAMLDEQIQVRKEEYDALVIAQKAVEAEKKKASSGLTNEQLEAKLKEETEYVAKLEAKMAPFKESGAKMITEAELEKAEGALKKW